MRKESIQSVNIFDHFILIEMVKKLCSQVLFKCGRHGYDEMRRYIYVLRIY